MNAQTLWQEYSQCTHAAPPMPLTVERGEGAMLWDTEGREYVDFAAGGGVNTLGYGDEKWVAALVEQAVKIPYVGPQLLSEPQIRLSQALCARSGMARVCYTASGSEANEGLLKLARQYSFQKYGKGRGTVLALENGHYGHTAATLAASGVEGPFLAEDSGFRHAEASLEGVEATGGHDVCAVLLELVQTAGGAYPMDRDFIHDLAVLCAERDWLLLIDEVRTAPGRTGTLFAYQQYGVLPDGVSFGGGMAGGLPLAGFLTGDKCRELPDPAWCGAAFGGTPLSAAGALTVLERLDETALARVGRLGETLRERLSALELPCLGAVRGLGLLVGVEAKKGFHAQELARRLLEEGLVVGTAAHDTLLFTPPLTITQPELDRGVAILCSALEPFSCA